MEQKILKALIAGNDGSGKTSFVAVLNNVMTPSGACPSIVRDWTKEIELGTTKYVFQVTDMACSHVLTSARKLYYADVNLVLLMFAVNDRESFLLCRSTWIPEIQSEVPSAGIVLIGNKTDTRTQSSRLTSHNFVETEEGYKLAEAMKLLGYFELSVLKERDRVEEVVYESVRRYLRSTGDNLANQLTSVVLSTLSLNRVQFISSTRTTSKHQVLRVVVLGSTKCGKSAFLWCLVHQKFPKPTTPPFVDEWRTICTIDDVPYALEVFDMSGLSESQKIVSSFVTEKTSVVIMLYNVLAATTLDDCRLKWFPLVSQLAPQATTVLVGTHTDQRATQPLGTPATVDNETGQAVAKKLNALFYEVGLPSEVSHARTIVAKALEHYADNVLGHKQLFKTSSQPSDKQSKTKSLTTPIQAPVASIISFASSGEVSVGHILKESTSKIK
jgi:GTPase SAR1 family protein